MALSSARARDHQEVAGAQQRAGAPRRRPARLGDIVVGLGFCDRDAVEAAAVHAIETGQQIGQVLLERGSITSDQLAVAMAKRFGLRHMSSDELSLDAAAAQLVSFAAARRMGAVPIGFADDQRLIVAVANPDNYLALEDMSMFTGMQIEAVVVSQEDLDVLLKRLSVLDGEVIEDETDSVLTA